MNVLVLEDDSSFASALKAALLSRGIEVRIALNLEEGLNTAKRDSFDAVLADLFLGPDSAFDFLAEYRKLAPHVPVIVMTSKHSIDTVIETTKSGAYDYFPKPDVQDLAVPDWPWAKELAEMIAAAVEHKELIKKVGSSAAQSQTSGVSQLLGDSKAMQEVFKAIGRAALSDATVLIRGETGTGKELAARALHGYSSRASGPFVVVNSAAIPETLLESELFGYEKGAFTGAQARRIGLFEQANRGTIFLDEIGDMSFNLQQKLLRVLQEKTIERVGGWETIPVDVRVVAATHRNLEEEIEKKNFRSDLYFRLNVLTINLPALSERRGDIPGLVEYFLSQSGPELGQPKPLITPEAIETLRQQPWPGNVRQLRNVVRKTLLLARGLVIGRQIVLSAMAEMAPPRPGSDQVFSEFVAGLLKKAQAGETEHLYDTVSEAVERELYEQAFRRAQQDQSKAARWLGVSRPTMLEKLRKYGIYPAEASQEEPAASRK